MTVKAENQVFNAKQSLSATGALVLANGEIFYGQGCGAIGAAVGEVCFNTAMTGYQEILTDPSYTDQIICFTFPHIGNTGTNSEDEEASTERAEKAAVGAIFKAPITPPSNWRSENPLGQWMKDRNIIGISGVDTRALTSYIRDNGMPNGVIAHHPDGSFDIDALTQRARSWNGLVGADLAIDVATEFEFDWTQSSWVWPEGYSDKQGAKKVVVIDYGVKRNILRNLVAQDMAIKVVPAKTSAKDILDMKPDGVVRRHGRLRHSCYSGFDQSGYAYFGNLPRPSNAGPGLRRQDHENGSRPPRRQPSGQRLYHKQGRNRLDESRLCRRSRQPAR